MFQEFARHRFQDVKQGDLHVATLTQEAAHMRSARTECSESSTAIKIREMMAFPRGVVVGRGCGIICHQASEGERWNSSTTGNASEAKSQYRMRIASEWVPAWKTISSSSVSE